MTATLPDHLSGPYPGFTVRNHEWWKPEAKYFFPGVAGQEIIDLTLVVAQAGEVLFRLR
jgi:hypothetical protein